MRMKFLFFALLLSCNLFAQNSLQLGVLAKNANNPAPTATLTAEGTPLAFTNFQAIRGAVAKLSPTRVVYAYYRSATVQNVQTFELNRSTKAVTANSSPLTFYTADGAANSPISVVVIDSAHFALFWTGADSDGFARTYQVDEDGIVTAWGAQIEFDTSNGIGNSGELLDANHIINVWASSSSIGTAAVFEIDLAGDLSIIGTPFAFTPDNCQRLSLKLVGNKALVSYQGNSSDGFVRALNINTSSWLVTAAGSAFEWLDASTVNQNSLEIMTTSPTITAINAFDNNSSAGLRQLQINHYTWAVSNLGTAVTGIAAVSQNNTKRVVLKVRDDYFLHFYTGTDNDGFVDLRSYNSSSGAISSSIVQIEFDTNNAIAMTACDMGDGLVIAIWASASNWGVAQAFQYTLPSRFETVNEIEIAPINVVRQSVNFDLEETTNKPSGFDWRVYNNTGTEIADAQTQTATFNIATLGFYSVKSMVERGTALDRYYPKILNVLPDFYEEGDADLVIDLDAVAAGTFSNPLGDLTYAGGGTENVTFNFQSVSRPNFKIYTKGDFSGRIVWVGLRGTNGNPAIIQSPTTGQTTSEAAHSSQTMAWHFNGNNQYIRIDGRASSTHKYGIKIIGDGGARRGILFQGDEQRGIEMYGVEIDMGRDPSDTSEGGSGFQWSPPTPDAGQNASNWSAEYIILMYNYIHNTWGEGVYIGYFSDAEQSGFRPDRMGTVLVNYNIFSHISRDPIQIASSDHGEVIGNVISYSGEEESLSHRAAIVWNDGNLDTYTYSNHITNVDLWISSQSGETGTGTGYIYSNFIKQRETILTTTPSNFAVLSVEGLDYDYQVFNNTIICPDVDDAPVGIYRASGGETYNFTFAGNVILTGGSDQATYDELSIIGTHDQTDWLVSNVWERTADEDDLLLDIQYKPLTGSPALDGGFNWQTRFPDVFLPLERNRDYFGYSLLNDVDYVAGYSR